MTEPEVPQQGPGDGQHDPASLAVLGPPRRPWQVMLAWTGADPPGPGLGEALGRILDLFPGTGYLMVHTASGSIMATRDFHGNYPAEVDGILARLFRDDPGVVGMTFPATPTRPAHTATPDDPHWSPLGKASAGIAAAAAAGRINARAGHRAAQAAPRPRCH